MFRQLNKHFPKHIPFHKFFNRNTVKLSYSCTPSMSSIILFNNRELLHEKPTPAISHTLCNRWKNTNCPLKGKCCSKSQVIKVVLTRDNVTKYYYGLCETTFKTRCNNHKHTFRHQDKRYLTELSKVYCNAIETGKHPNVK